MSSIIQNIRQELKQNSEGAHQKSGQRFFKEKINIYGVKTAFVSKTSKQYFRTIKSQSKTDIFKLCDDLWKSGYIEESFVACNWSYFIRQQYEPEDFKTFENWLNNYVNNWASCDTLCNHTIGAFVDMYPEFLSELKKWAKSENRWMRRGAAVTLIIPARQGKFLNDVFEIADALLTDQDDLVQKGYGWMLKAASQFHQQEVFDYVMKNKTKMPRTALRYAIEKMPKEWRAQAMEKEAKGNL